ncbi:exodeoxyribonuclease III, putative [Plasmodium gallinaceum]|uniref:Exodeoxyribonuclease III, putative n=1 Tax=Plasmodium gallinaceum TaxID=5849 RepID=A0A1J1GTJ7_PLAGA|nr:exodeoxyribonuclease III, putative [Plasmodium gallinaceum]CRG95810.1 exodeoxyribonuclease III, putative [Plasmodium gallinaceum]
MEKFHIVSWNVNGWKRSTELIKKKDGNLFEFLKKLDIDILCLQETKTNDSVIENDFNLIDAYSDNYESYWNCCKRKNNEKTFKGYSGIATYVNNKTKIICSTNKPFKNFSFFINNVSKNDLLIKRKSKIDGSSISFFLINEDNNNNDKTIIKNNFTKNNIINSLNTNNSTERSKYDNKNCINREKENTHFLKSVSDFFNEGRILITIHKNFIVVNIYVPYSGNNYDRIDYKMKFLHAVRAKLIQLRITTGLPIILLGDFNVSYRNRDVYYLNNIINLNKLLENIEKINLKEDLKNKIRQKLPIIIDKLKSKNNFVIKKQKTENSEFFHFFLNFDGNLKKIGKNFSSLEEIFFFFSLDTISIEDKYINYPNEYYFFLNNSMNISESTYKNDNFEDKGKINEHMDNFEMDSKLKINYMPKDKSNQNFILSNNNNYNNNNNFIEKDYINLFNSNSSCVIDSCNINYNKKYLNKIVENDAKFNNVKEKLTTDYELKKNYESFSINSEYMLRNITKNKNKEMEEYFLNNNENIKYNERLKNKIKSCKKILCRYKFKSCLKGKYIVKNENCLYLKHLNDIFLSLDIVLSKDDLLNIANSVGSSSSPKCCTDFLKNLIFEDNMIDTFSYFHNTINGKFTCWDTYKQYRVTNEGSRIDYILIDYIIYEKFIKEYNYLYESPIILNDEIKKLLLKNGKNNDINYDYINSMDNNRNYANYFNKLKKKIKYDFNENVNNSEDDEFYDLQFKFLSYIGFIYTSPKLSDHIAVNCTFIINDHLTKSTKKITKICCSDYDISLKYICNSLDQYIICLPLYLINSPIFSLCCFMFLNHMHLHSNICQSITETQPHKKTNKITKYFSKKIK